MLSIPRYFHTLRYLKPVQIYGRLWRNLYYPGPDLVPPPALRQPSSTWCEPIGKIPSFIVPNLFRFLNTEHVISSISDWNNTGWPKLWLYNLHYFDCLSAVNAADYRKEYLSLIIRWIEANPPGKGIGWEPYPLSIRIVNWIKWTLAGNPLPNIVLESLAAQVRCLLRRIEFHLLGNHLFANAVALVFAGFFFLGDEANTWLDKGMRVLKQELPEQILADGGHFERSTMYHSIFLEGLLDIINVTKHYSDTQLLKKDNDKYCHCYPGKQHEVGYMFSILFGMARSMLAWLKIMCHPDGQISLFNDAAFKVAPDRDELKMYAERLGVEEQEIAVTDEILSGQPCIQNLFYGSIKVIHLKSSGYIRVVNGPVTIILDVAPVGPDYLPGHAHADTFSFEMSINEERVIVDSGTSLYDNSLERYRQRGTSAHNTVMINREDSSEIWGSFRVARRAEPYDLDIQKTSDGCRISCSHNGYQRLWGKPVHRREWYFRENSMEIRDTIKGKFKEAVSRFHFHPDVDIVLSDECDCFLPIGKKEQTGFSHKHGTMVLSRDRTLRWIILEGRGNLIETTYHPEFGISLPNKCLEIFSTGPESHISFKWQC